MHPMQPGSGESAEPDPYGTSEAAGAHRSVESTLGDERLGDDGQGGDDGQDVDVLEVGGFEPFPAQTPAAPSVHLTAVEARVVGALIEKAFLTPDIYPMTTNALVSASNQKTNRDPVMSLDAVTIDGALMELRQRNLVRRVHTQGSRSTKHRHALDEVLSLGPGALAVVSVLLLRGAQTVGELRLRTERQHGFETLDEVDACLEGLASSGLVRQLARQPGQKEARWQHLLGDGEEPEVAAAPFEAPSAPVQAASPAAAPPAAVPPARAADQDLIDRVGELEAEVETLRTQLRRLADQLGEPLD